MSDVIAAVATGWKAAAIGIIRLSGTGAIAVAQKVFLCQNGRALTEIPDRKLVLGYLKDALGRVIDQALVTVDVYKRQI